MGDLLGEAGPGLAEILDDLHGQVLSAVAQERDLGVGVLTAVILSAQEEIPADRAQAPAIGDARRAHLSPLPLGELGEHLHHEVPGLVTGRPLSGRKDTVRQPKAGSPTARSRARSSKKAWGSDQRGVVSTTGSIRRRCARTLREVRPRIAASSRADPG
ncbi:MAG: hypothetical protein IPG17_24655 [Sandaracinaceae bacterium]|nr:hypothetical protein [Sandaracinaceae bacterium]